MMTIGTIKTRLTVWGFAIPAEAFDKMTYTEILKFYRKARKANSIKLELERMVNSKREGKVEKK